MSEKTFTFFPTSILPKPNKPILIRFRKVRGTRIIYTQGFYEVVKFNHGGYVRYTYRDEQWCDFSSRAIFKVSYKDDIKVSGQKQSYKILEWAYIT